MNRPVVRISTGFLRGAIKKATNRNKFYSFEGIPFAEPPLGVLRFKAPIPAKEWPGIRDAHSQSLPNCYVDHSRLMKDKGQQKKEFSMGGSEDCLYLNVFTPSLPIDNDNLKSVMVFIHGGAYTSGGTQKYGPEVILSEDVILVTISYRLGALGFLAINDQELGVTGNAGLKDMALALKWIKQNIKAFNGDTDNITIFGESAGASSVHYLVLSPKTKGLFHKAIIQSGSSLCHWARGNPQNGIELAKYLGCTANDNISILKYLQNIPVYELLQGQHNIPEKILPSTTRYFAPVMENANDEDAFLTELPIDLMTSGRYHHIPMIFGFNSNEGALFSLPIFQEDYTSEDSIVPFWLNLDRRSEEYMKLAKEIRAFYLKNGPDKTEDGVISEAGAKLAGDISFLRPVMQSAKIHSKSSKEPIYLYRLSVTTKLAYITGGKTKGVCHADGLGYQFLLPTTPTVAPGSIEDISRNRIVKLFTNFAKQGNPNYTDMYKSLPSGWEPIKNGEIRLLDIGEELSMQINPEAESMALWDEIFKTYEHTKYY